MQEARPPWMRLVQLALTALLPVGLGGAYAAALGWRDGAFLMLAWAAHHLRVASRRRRLWLPTRAMEHEWPRVAPLEAYDWDD